MNLSKVVASVVALGLAGAVAMPAQARRIVIDAGFSIPLSGYCSPNEAASAGGCTPTALPFSIQIGGQTYNSVYVNSNGTLSFESIASTLAQQNTGLSRTGPYTGPAPADSLGDYPAPIFSPNFVDGPGYLLGNLFGPPIGADGTFASTQTVTANSLTVNFFTCETTDRCGQATIDAIANESYNPNSPITRFILNGFDPFNPPPGAFEGQKANLLTRFGNSLDIFTLVLTDLDDGFTIDYRYSPSALGDTGLSGFNLPGGLAESTGPLVNRSFRFDSTGQLVAPGVPEPGTWLSMLLGFGVIGAAMRGRRRARLQPA
jgi:hypothetical protein